MFKHLMLVLIAQPTPTPEWALNAVDSLAVHCDAELVAALSTITIPDMCNALARRLVGADAAIAAENQRGVEAADALATRFASVIGSSDKHRLERFDSCGILDPQLACHRVVATSRRLAQTSADAGTELMAYARERHADLLVMRGFGHARMREFFLGGATRSVIEAPLLPVLLSH